MKVNKKICAVFVTAAVIVSVIACVLLSEADVGRYDMQITKSGAIIIFDTKTGDMEGCLSEGRDFENILTCKKMIRLRD